MIRTKFLDNYVVEFENEDHMNLFNYIMKGERERFILTPRKVTLFRDFVIKLKVFLLKFGVTLRCELNPHFRDSVSIVAVFPSLQTSMVFEDEIFRLHENKLVVVYDLKVKSLLSFMQYERGI